MPYQIRNSCIQCVRLQDTVKMISFSSLRNGLIYATTLTDSVLIPMDDPTKEEARQILSSLVGLESNVIPENIKGVADEILKGTEGNPFAVACLASNFAFAKDKTRKGLASSLDNII